MQLTRQFFCQTVLACAAVLPFAALHAQSMPDGPPPGTGGPMTSHGPGMEEMHRMHGTGGMDGMMGHHGPGMGGMGHPDMAFLHGLDLDDAQGDQVFMIMHEQAPQLRMIQKSRERAERDLDNLVRSGQYSDAAARPMVDAIVKSAADATYLRARAQSRIVALLRPDQRARLTRAGTRAMIRPAPDIAAPPPQPPQPPR